MGKSWHPLQIPQIPPWTGDLGHTPHFSQGPVLGFVQIRRNVGETMGCHSVPLTQKCIKCSKMWPFHEHRVTINLSRTIKWRLKSIAFTPMVVVWHSG